MATVEDRGATAERPGAERAPLPAGWRGGRTGKTRATYAYGSHIEIYIEPRYLTKRAQRHGKPSQFRVELRKRFYAHELTGKGTLLGSTDSFDAADAIAKQYMATFVEDRKEVGMEIREELEADPVMAQEAEEAIVTEAATEAAIEVAGYSDELLVNDLRGLLESGADATILQAVVHQDANGYEVAFVADGYEGWGQGHRLREFYKQFEWLNNQKLSTTLSVGQLSVLIGAFEETRMIRYLADEDQESIILIEPDHPIHVPPFERQVADIVSAKWDRDGSDHD